jgi:hypothetical protein
LHFRVASTVALPLTALVASAVTALVLAAQVGLAFCNARVALPMPGMADMPGMASMPGMAMPSVPSGGHVLMICPVVLALIVSSGLLAALALVALWRDPHGGLARRGVVRALAGLPPLRTAGVLAVLGAVAVATMLAVDHAAPPALPSCFALAGLLAACSAAAVALSMAAGRIALAFGRRLILAVAAAAALRPAPSAPLTLRLVPRACGVRAASPLAAGRGLRAPPRFVR